MERGFLLLLALLVTVTFAQTYDVNIAFTSYVRGNFVPYYNSSSCSAYDSCAEATYGQLTDAAPQLIGGCSLRSRYIDSLRTSLSNNLLIVDAGSYFWGSAYNETIAAACIEEVHYDVINLGASDFYDGTEKLADFTKLVPTTTDIINANLDLDDARETFLTSTDNRPASYSKGQFIPSVVKTINSVNVLFVGIVEEKLYTIPRAATVAPTEETGTSLDFRLRIAIYDAKVANPTINAVVVLADVDRPIALRLARQVEGINAIITNRFGTGDPAGVTTVTSAYDLPVYVTNIGTGLSGSNVGLLTFTVDTTTNAVSAATVSTRRITNKDGDLPPPSASQSIITQSLTYYRQALEIANGVVVADSTVPMSVFQSYDDADPFTPPVLATAGCRNYDCGLGRLVVQAYRDTCELTYGDGKCDFALINSGMLRASMPVSPVGTGAQSITALDVMQVLPYRNQIITQKVTGAVIRAALQHSSTKIREGGFLQTNLHVSYHYNADSVAANDALVEVVYPHPTTGVLTPLVDEETYSIAIPVYLYQGGDGYGSIFSTPGNPTYGDVDVDVTTRYLDGISAGGQVYKAMSDSLKLRCLNNVLPWATAAEKDCFVLVSDIPASEYQFCPTNADFCTAPPSFLGRANVFVDTTDECKSCSGLGSCYLRSCTCNVPEDGLWRGKPIIRGSDCSEVAELWTISAGVEVLVTLLLAITLIICLGVGAAIIYFGDRRAVKATSPMIGLLMCGAGIVTAIGAYIDMASRVYEFNDIPGGCMISVWLIAIGYTGLFGCLFMRTYRIHLIFSSTRKVLRRVIFTDIDIILRVLGLIGVNVIILTVFSAVSPLTQTGDILSSTDDSFYAKINCTTENEIFMTVLLIYNALLLLWGIYLAVSTRSVDTNFNESTHIGAAIYNCAFIAVICIPLVVILGDSLPDLTYAIQAIAVFYVVIFTLLVVYIPRFIKAYHNEETGAVTQNLQMTSLSSVEGSTAPYTDYIRILETKLREKGEFPERPAGLIIPVSASALTVATNGSTTLSGNGSAKSPTASSNGTSAGGFPTLKKPEKVSAFDRQNSLRNKQFNTSSGGSSGMSLSSPTHSSGNTSTIAIPLNTGASSSNDMPPFTNTTNTGTSSAPLTPAPVTVISPQTGLPLTRRSQVFTSDFPLRGSVAADDDFLIKSPPNYAAATADAPTSTSASASASAPTASAAGAAAAASAGAKRQFVRRQSITAVPAVIPADTITNTNGSTNGNGKTGALPPRSTPSPTMAPSSPPQQQRRAYAARPKSGATGNRVVGARVGDLPPPPPPPE